MSCTRSRSRFGNRQLGLKTCLSPKVLPTGLRYIERSDEHHEAERIFQIAQRIWTEARISRKATISPSGRISSTKNRMLKTLRDARSRSAEQVVEREIVQLRAEMAKTHRASGAVVSQCRLCARRHEQSLKSRLSRQPLARPRRSHSQRSERQVGFRHRMQFRILFAGDEEARGGASGRCGHHAAPARSVALRFALVRSADGALRVRRL